MTMPTPMYETFAHSPTMYEALAYSPTMYETLAYPPTKYENQNTTIAPPEYEMLPENDA